MKTPQQIRVSFVKDDLCKKVLDIKPSQVYHVTIMPCFDKKLEASRKDFFDEVTQSKQVFIIIIKIIILLLLLF